MRWSELRRSSKGAGGKPRGWKTRSMLDKEREATREELRRDYENFQQAAAVKTEEAKARCAQRIEEYLKAVEWAAAYERFEKMDGWDGDKIEVNIN